MANAVNMVGRGVGALTGLGVSAGWFFAIWVPTAGLTLTGIDLVVALLMAALALFGMIASVRGHVIVVTLVFLASFFPVGVALATAEHWMRWVGRANVGFLVAALLIWAGSRFAKAPHATEVGSS
jgi:hypothetical protein